ncbi:MAG: imelysin family protein [Crocinitomix sp.]|nr:imelysin family protein [Crocinitomix sp.]|tara:strand:+ start:2710 stop:3777 length:1068 start_codon:yes stop_codon:yes gene_type:complete
MRLLNLIIISFLVVSACKKSDEVEFDRSTLLTNMANVEIKPGLASFTENLFQLSEAAADFDEATSFDNLSALRTAFSNTYLQFQAIKMYDFGPSANNGIKSSMNTYPTDSDKIDANITSGSYTLGAVANVDAIGFPAIDYLLFEGDDIAVLNRFASDPDAENAMTYLTDLIAKMILDFAPVPAEWNTSYTEIFLAADGTDIGSSVSLLYNEFVKDLELLKNAKIGIPAGVFSGGETFPTYVESYYSEESKILALESISALKDVFTGGEGIGFDDYMDFVSNTEDTPLAASEITGQFDVCFTKIDALSNPLSSDIPVNLDGFNTAFQEIKKLVAYAKTDIPTILGVLISFSDTDGD